MPFEEEFQKEVNNVTNCIKHQKIPVSNLLCLMDNIGDLTPICISSFGAFLKEVLIQYKTFRNKQNSVKPKESAAATEHSKSLSNIHDEGIAMLCVLCKQRDRGDLRSEALSCLINLLPVQAKCLTFRVTFPVENFVKILNSIICADGHISSPLMKLKEFLVYTDMSTFIWKALENIVSSSTFSSSNVHNTLLVIGLLSKPEATVPEEDIKYFCGLEGLSMKKKHIGASVLKIWEKLISIETTISTKQLLVLTVIDKLTGRMENPVLLTDYFMDCLNDGGAVSMLGLQGIFELIQKHNITYPNIYTKLYSMFSPDVFSTPYKSRLYYLSDIFLTSSHLPEATVAGFIKRFSRLSLVAPPPDIIILLKFITNLILRHPGLKKLVHNINAVDVDSDPYNYDEVDPRNSRGIDSSLWEVKLLQEHILPSVSAAAMFISNPLPSVEINIGDLLEVTTSDIFEREYKKKMKETPMCFLKPSGFIQPNTQSGISLWSLCD